MPRSTSRGGPAGKGSTPFSSRSGSVVSMTPKWAVIDSEAYSRVRSLAARTRATKDRSADPLQRCDDVMPCTLFPSSLCPSHLCLGCESTCLFWPCLFSHVSGLVVEVSLTFTLGL